MASLKLLFLLAFVAVFSAIESTPQGLSLGGLGGLRLGGLGGHDIGDEHQSSKSRSGSKNQQDDALTLTLALPLNKKQSCQEEHTEIKSHPRFESHPRFIPQPRIITEPSIIHQPQIYSQPQFFSQPHYIHHQHQPIISESHIIEQPQICHQTQEIIGQQHHIIQPQIISQPIHGQPIYNSYGHTEPVEFI